MSFLPTVVALTQADAAAVAKLFGRCARYFLLQDGEPAGMADAHAVFTDVPPGHDAREKMVLGCWAGCDLLGVAEILRDYPDTGVWYLGFLIVDEAARGRGVGCALYAAVEDRAARAGASEIRLAVLEDNTAGARFWCARGFAEIRRVGPDTFKRRRHRRIEFGRRIEP
ncbi:GNAT family N-acetyltransferase [Sphingomonas jatrophae]|uniref:Acetyltransferase (GNAT) family protein n=1 Tax=Sphingomonas jatrophae TaxID=1166337 RepID=A0A1I6LQR8_9SPHN|nr:GNAT family N-acetyltransferase [Sphingomonas jatrophae]SFS05801.1 Acetyltransferase (GNAT) family protein [Sphingomonas jatrophae]